MGTHTEVSATSVTASIHVTPVPSAISVNTSNVDGSFQAKNTISISENGGAFSLPIASYINTAILNDPSEKVFVQFILPIGISLTNKDVIVNPISSDSVSGTSKYVITLDESSLSDQLANYKLLPSSTYVTPEAGASISVTVNSLEPSTGAQGLSPQTITTKLYVKPVPDIPQAPISLTKTATIQENNEVSTLTNIAPDLSSRFLATNAINLLSLVSVNPNAETLKVAVTASSSLMLEVFNPTSNTYTNLIPNSSSDSTNSYVMSTADYQNLYIQGVGHAKSSSAIFSVKTLDEATWGGASSAFSSPVTATFTITPVANGIATSPQLQTVSSWEDLTNNANTSVNAPLLSQFISVGATEFDSSETLYYKVSIPKNMVLKGLNGFSVPLASVDNSVGTATSGDLVYSIKASDLSNYQIIPPLHFSGDVDIGIQAYSQEADGSKSFDANVGITTLHFNPISYAPTLVTPSTDTGLISAASPNVGIPIQIVGVDSGLLSARIYVSSPTLNNSNVSTLSFSDGTNS